MAGRAYCLVTYDDANGGGTIRVSTVLGMVGAGGIGFELISSMKLFAYEDTAACVIVILVLVLAADLMSSKLRAMIR